MEHVPILGELALIAAASVVVSIVLSRLQLPTMAGLIVAGALLGPSGFRMVTSMDTIHVLAEVGVVLLLFTIGLEISLARLAQMVRYLVVGGSLQVGLTAAVTVGVARALELEWSHALVYGFILALSSTAIVLKVLQSRAEIDAPHGRFIVGALLFQDLAVVPMMLVVAALGSDDGGSGVALAWALAKAALVVVATLVGARVLVPRLFALVDASRSREVFLLTVLLLCIGTAWLTSLAGLSLALGAFLGGLVVADTEYGHRALGDVLPLREAFTAIFFVSLGMLFDVWAVIAAPLAVGGLVVAFLFGKGLLATLAALAMRFPARVAWLAGVGLAQFGEFGFVVANVSQDVGLLTAEEVSTVVSAGIVTMFLSPLLMKAAPHVKAGERILRPLENLLGARGVDDCLPSDRNLEGHVILVGYGVGGQLVARALESRGKPYLVLELNADTVRKARAADQPVYYADATSPEALEHASIRNASAVVLLINDPRAALRTIAVARNVAPDTPVFLRTRYLADERLLRSLAPEETVFEELEAALELTRRLLRSTGTPEEEIEAQLREARKAVTPERGATAPA